MQYEVLIVGQGLAGSALSMALLKRGVSFAVVDDAAPSAASRVAAGLVTTLAGKGMNPAWRQSAYWPKSLAYYRKLEQESGVSLFHEHPVLRLFADEKEARKFGRKHDAVAKWVGNADPEIDAEQVHGAHGGFEMAQGGRLDTQAYLQVVRDILIQAGVAILECEFDESELSDGGGTLGFSGLSAKKVILCQGARGLLHGHFSDLEHRSAKGEMLTVKVPGLSQERIINRNGWMVPIGGDLWRAGATYGWDDLEPNATQAGREAVWQKVADLTPMPVGFVGHEVGVRPIIRRSQPVIGFSKEEPRLGLFNGLGSKGVISAPCVAEHFVDFLVGKIETLDPELALD